MKSALAQFNELTAFQLSVIVVAIAVALRLWGIDYGLPFVYWTDEYHEVMRAMELGAGGFNFGRTSKGGFYLLLFFEYAIYYVFLRVLESSRPLKSLQNSSQVIQRCSTCSAESLRRCSDAQQSHSHY